MSWVGGSRLGFEDVFAGAGQAHIFAGDTFDGGGIGLQVFHVVLQCLIFFVQLIDFLLDFAGFYLRAMHGQDAVRAENVLYEQQREACDEKPIHIAAEKRAELLGKRWRGVVASCFSGGGLLMRASFGDPCARVLCQFFRGSGLCGFRVNPHDWLGARRAHQNPRAVVENQLQAIGAVSLGDLVPREFAEIFAQALRQLCLRFRGKMQILANRPVFAANPAEKIAQLLAERLRRAAIISATSRQARMPSFSGRWPWMVMPALSSPPSAILSGAQQRADVLEADGSFVGLNAVQARDGVDQMRGGNAARGAQFPPRVSSR